MDIAPHAVSRGSSWFAFGCLEDTDGDTALKALERWDGGGGWREAETDGDTTNLSLPSSGLAGWRMQVMSDSHEGLLDVSHEGKDSRLERREARCLPLNGQPNALKKPGTKTTSPRKQWKRPNSVECCTHMTDAKKRQWRH